MVRIGWITMDKFGDGDVIEINLATVKVRNLTIPPLIPTYS
jgi:miniconductance mechanosensitive channel